ncbi:hypothetical protein NM208_g10497 [Fusarium decemcellulare]|uniref:Uncharacterized protein n=1 Tax=Fusarium decemcellulare TaxID=57161 RepID=A0ACC1RXN8_9HYPO|nr:hypothetical protein NM208_g10497 [Fusarium decemcellulare]
MSRRPGPLACFLGAEELFFPASTGSFFSGQVLFMTEPKSPANRPDSSQARSNGPLGSQLDTPRTSRLDHGENLADERTGNPTATVL